MARIRVTDNAGGQNSLLFIQTNVAELLGGADCKVALSSSGGRATLTVDAPDCYGEIVDIEIIDKVAEIIAVKYKYDYFKSAISVTGLSEDEKEILLASLIAADFYEDKKYAVNKMKGLYDIAIDGVFNFWLKPLKRKWAEIVTYVPMVFLKSQLKEFVSFLLENRKKRIYVDGGKVYDANYKRLFRVELLPTENLKLLREIILSGGGEIELLGEVPKADEMYLKEFYGDKIYFSRRYFG